MSPRIESVVFALTCVAQLAYPAGMIVGHELILRVGTPVRVRCEAVDPSDILRGRYVQLRLEPFTIPVEKPEDYYGSPTVEQDVSGGSKVQSKGER